MRFCLARLATSPALLCSFGSVAASVGMQEGLDSSDSASIMVLGSDNEPAGLHFMQIGDLESLYENSREKVEELTGFSEECIENSSYMDRYFTDACRMFFHDLERLKPHFSCDDKEKVEILKKEPEELKRYLAEKADPKKILDEYRLASNTFESSYYRSKKHVRKDPSKIYLKKLMRSVGCFVKAYTVLRAYEKAVQLSDGLDAETHVLEA